ncbi:MAG: penicillin-binding protein activator [Desulfobaccales bacterium]
MRLRFFISCLALLLLSACQATTPAYRPLWPSAVQERGDSLFMEAENYYRRQQYRQALQAYGAYLKQSPKGPEADQARLREAELLGLLGDWQGSLSKYQEILSRVKEGHASLKARYGIGRAYFKLGRYQSAVGVLESLTASDLPGPLRFSTNALLAEIALKKGEIEAAFVRLRLAERDLAAGDQEWFDYVKNRLVEQATPAELEHLANLYRDSALTAPLLLRLARLAQEEGRTDEAGKWLQILKERFPQSKEARSAAAGLATSRPVIGCLVPLSGDFAPYGSRLKQGMELAAQGGRFDLVYRDCPNDPAQASRLVLELAGDSRVLALLGPLTSGDAQAAAEAAQAAGIPLIALSQKQDLTAAGSLIFQIFLTPRLQVQALLRHTLGKENLRNYAILAPESSYGRTLARIFKEELAAQGGHLVTEVTYPLDTEDFGPVIRQLLTASQSTSAETSSLEALFIPDDAAAIAAVVNRLANQSQHQVRILATNVAHPKENQELARALDGLLFTEAFFAADPNPAVQSFVAAYRQRYGVEPDYLAAQGYMAVRLLGQLVESQMPVARAEIPSKLMALRSVPNLPWFGGFATDRQASLEIYLLTLKDGRVEMTFSPAGGRL